MVDVDVVWLLWIYCRCYGFSVVVMDVVWFFVDKVPLM